MGKLQPGMKYSHEFTVSEKMLAKNVGSGLVSVLATVMMIAGMEEAAVETVQSSLEDGYTTVGTHVDVSHEAATPVGMKVRFEAELLEISPNGKGLTFRVTASDEKEIIGQGIHKRVIVPWAKFEEKTGAKGARA